MTKLLLVEDKEMNRSILSRRLLQGDDDVVMVLDDASGVAVVDTAASNLMDLRLPLLYGREATQPVNVAPTTRPIFGNALTTHTMFSNRDKALEAGCDDNTRPVELPHLLANIEALLTQVGQGATA